MNPWLALVLFLLASFAAAAFGSLFTDTSGWYQQLRKPAWNPPAWAFGPVWTTLYVFMAVAAWRVWLRAGWEDGRVPLALFFIQLALNAAWTPVFFGAQMPGAAFAVIVVLWAAIAATLVAFWQVAPSSGALFVPYLAWVSFAAALNFAIWRMNPGA